MTFQGTQQKQTKQYDNTKTDFFSGFDFPHIVGPFFWLSLSFSLFLWIGVTVVWSESHILKHCRRCHSLVVYICQKKNEIVGCLFFWNSQYSF